jgi:YVTN family beta-propeller protein
MESQVKNGDVPARCSRLVILLAFAALLLIAAPGWAVAPLGTIPVGLNPGQVVVNPATHSVYVVNTGDNTVSVIDSEKLTVTKVIPVGKGPTAIAINPLVGVVFVANSSAGSITGIQGTKVVGTVHIGGNPVAMVVDVALNQLYVADAARNQVEILNATTGKLLGTLPTVLQPTVMALDIASHGVWVACTGASGSVVVIDGTHNQIATTVNGIPAGTTSISVDPVTDVAVLAIPSANDTVSINGANGYSIQITGGAIGADPIATAFDPIGLFLVADSGDGVIYFAEGDGNFGLGNFYEVEASEAEAIAVNPTTNQFAVDYAPGEQTYLIDLLNPLFRSDYHQVFSGRNNRGLAFDPITARLFVANNGDNTVSAFDVSPRTETPAFEKDLGGSNVDSNYIDTNPATGTTYTLRLANLFAINEAQAGAGSNGMGGNGAGVTTIPLANAFSNAVAVNAATNKIYVGDSAGFFYSVAGDTNVATLLTVLPSTADIRALAVDSATNEILAWDYHGNSVYVLDGSTEALLKTVPVTSANPGFLFVDPTTNLAYSVLGSVYVIDPAAGTVVTTISLPAPSLAAALNPRTKRLYVLTTSNLVVIDTGKNSVVTTTPLPYSPVCVGVNPLTGNYFLGLTQAGIAHVLVYNGASDTLIADLSGTDHPEITGDSDIQADILSNTIFVGTDQGTTTSIVAAIDGLTQTVSAVAPSAFDFAAHALAVDLSTGLLAGTGYSYTTLWFPTSDISGEAAIPIAIAMQGVPDGLTIATHPIFRTRNPQPSFYIQATGNFQGQPPGLVPKQAFYQVDGWQGTWTTTALTPNGANSAFAKVKVPTTLSTGRHILYSYASVGDVATVQSSLFSENSPVISPIASVVFTVEK